MSLLIFSLSVLVFSISFFIISYSSMWILNEFRKNYKQPIDNDYQQSSNSKPFNEDEYTSNFIKSYDARIERMKMEMAEDNIQYTREENEMMRASEGLYIIPDEEVDVYLQGLIDAEDEVSK